LVTEVNQRRSSKSGAGVRIATVALIAVAVGFAGAAGLVRNVRGAIDEVNRREEVADSLDAPHPDFVNYLFVGSDCNLSASASVTSEVKGSNNVGSATEIGGERGDTLMVLHYVKKTGTVSLISLPRDLWVAIGSRSNEHRINTAYQLGPDVLVRTVQRALGIPVHHYVEVNFQGFKSIVDAVGGVQMCVEHPSRDRHTGLFMRQGCSKLDGVKALAYARSRHFEQKVENEWRLDGTADIGRTGRQRLFVQALATSAVSGVSDNPFRVGSVMTNGLAAVSVDPTLDLIEFAKTMRPAAGGRMTSFPLPVYGDSVQGNSVLRLGQGSSELLAFFAGTGPRPQIDTD
jgi:LCP family protein required for cell wall assembly